MSVYYIEANITNAIVFHLLQVISSILIYNTKSDLDNEGLKPLIEISSVIQVENENLFANLMP